MNSATSSGVRWCKFRGFFVRFTGISTWGWNVARMAANSSVQHRLHFLNNFLRNSADGRVSPIRSQLCTDVLNLSSSSSRYYKRKAVQAVETVLEAIAPQQSTCLFNRVAERYSSGRDGNRSDNQLVGRLIKLYEEANSGYTRQKILSIFVCDHSKSELLTLIPGLTK